MPTAAARDLAAAEEARHREAVKHAVRTGSSIPRGKVKVVSQRRSFGEDVVLAHIPESLKAGEIIYVPVQGQHEIEAEVPNDDSDLWLENRCVQFVVPRDEPKKEPEKEPEEEKEVISHGEEYQQRLEKGNISTAPDEELADKNFAQVKERPQDKFDFTLTRKESLKLENNAYGE